MPSVFILLLWRQVSTDTCDTVGELASDCRRLEQEGKSRLALRLMNCQLAVQQGATFPCPRRQSIKECTEVLPDRAYALFVEFLTHADRCAWGGRAMVCVCGGSAGGPGGDGGSTQCIRLFSICACSGLQL